MREFLSDHEVRFVDRNIRRSEAARAELTARTDALVVPQLFWRGEHIVGFEPSELAAFVEAYRQVER